MSYGSFTSVTTFSTNFRISSRSLSVIVGSLGRDFAESSIAAPTPRRRIFLERTFSSSESSSSSSLGRLGVGVG